MRHRRRLARHHFAGRRRRPAAEFRPPARRRRVAAPGDLAADATGAGVDRRRHRQAPGEKRRPVRRDVQGRGGRRIDRSAAGLLPGARAGVRGAVRGDHADVGGGARGAALVDPEPRRGAVNDRPLAADLAGAAAARHARQRSVPSRVGSVAGARRARPYLPDRAGASARARGLNVRCRQPRRRRRPCRATTTPAARRWRWIASTYRLPTGWNRARRARSSRCDCRASTWSATTSCGMRCRGRLATSRKRSGASTGRSSISTTAMSTAKSAASSTGCGRPICCWSSRPSACSRCRRPSGCSSTRLGNASLSGSHERAPDGFLLAYGAHVKRGRLPRGSVVDVAPTILYFLDLPVGRDMDGFARADIFTRDFAAERPIAFIPTYER